MEDGLYPDDDSIGIDHIRAELNQIEYITKVGIRSESYDMIPDTGSSDMWIGQEGFKCLDSFHGLEVPQEDCQFNPRSKGDFPGGKIDNQNLNISYLSGVHLNGNMGYAEQALPDITVPKQQFALMNIAAFGGDGISRGILGLGLRGLTAAFTGDDPSADGSNNLMNYAPPMGTSKATRPILSFTMSRQENRSYIAFEEERNSKAEDEPVKNLPDMLVDSGMTQLVSVRGRSGYQRGILDKSQVWSVPCIAGPPTLDIVIGGKPISTHPSSTAPVAASRALVLATLSHIF
ncbi:acid protease [Xylariaceae sp. AK1471]|nr:acid protease [Xylariaceae sp. AK1471]